MKYITIKKFSELSGYSQDAIRAKIRKSVWREGTHWRKAPDGRVLICVSEIEAWVAQ